ncbi:flavodoxin domain-containing protein (plasmid) [Mesorhizobium sp. ORM8.1]
MTGIAILVASMTGTAEIVAEDISVHLGDGQSEIRLMDEVNASDFSSFDRLLIVSSTYGDGEVPDPGKALFEELKAGRPDLSHIVFGVISLGDMRYKDTFAWGGKHWQRLLQELGATSAGDPMTIDASGEQPDLQAWADKWMEQLKAVA